MSAVVILGIDPGTASTGLAVVIIEPGLDDQLAYRAVIRTKKNLAMWRRFCTIYEAAERLCDEHRPNAIAIEDFIYQGKNIAPDAWECRGLVGALQILGRQWPIEMRRAFVWKHRISGLPVPRKVQLPGANKIALDRAVRWAVRARLRISVPETIHTVDWADAAGIALVVGDELSLRRSSSKWQ